MKYKEYVVREVKQKKRLLKNFARSAFIFAAVFSAAAGFFKNSASGAVVSEIKGERVERNYSNHYSVQFSELWDTLGRSEVSVYDINYNIGGQYYPTAFNDTEGRDSAGYEILLSVDGAEVWLGNSHYQQGEGRDSFYGGYGGIFLKDIWFDNEFTDAAGNCFTQVNIELSNQNKEAKLISLATTCDIEVGHDDNAYCKFFGNGFTMSNKYADNSEWQGGTIPTVALNVYASGVPGVTDADAVYIGEWTQRKRNAWSNNVLGSRFIINEDRHGAMSGSEDCVDVGMSIAWKDRYINPGESVRFSYILGVNEFNSEYEQINEYYRQCGVDAAGNPEYELVGTISERVDYGNEYFIDINKYLNPGYYFERCDCSGKVFEGQQENLSYTVVSRGTNKIYYNSGSYSVTYMGNGGIGSFGESEHSEKVLYGSRYTVKDNLYDRAGYTFCGWNEKPDGSGEEWTSRIGITDIWDFTDNIVLYAQWNKNTDTRYTVRHWLQNIGSDPDKRDEFNYSLMETEVLHGQTEEKVAPDVKYYYGFEAPEKISSVISGDGTTIIDYYYLRNQHYVSYNVGKNKGSWGNGSNSDYYVKVPYGAQINLNEQGSREEWNFTGWNTDPDKFKGLDSLLMPDENVELFALFSKNITVEFWDFKGQEERTAYLYNRESNAVMLSPDISEYMSWSGVSGITAAGWTDCGDVDKAAGRISVLKPSGEFIASEDKRFYAVYEAYAEIRYDVNGGLEGSETESKKYKVYKNASDLSKTRGAEIVLPCCSRNTEEYSDGYLCSYELSGWEVDGVLYQPGDTIVICADTEAKAVWKENITAIKYTVVFDANGGENAPEPLALNYGESAVLPAPPVKKGCVFVSWNTDREGRGKSYDNFAVVKNLTSKNNSEVILYAQWKTKDYRLIKIASSMHGAAMVNRSSGDNMWYDTVGKLKVKDIISYPENKCVQQWRIDCTGNIVRTA